MLKKEIIKKIMTALNKEDYLIVVGKTVCDEVYQYDANSIYYIEEYYGISFAVGVAAAMDKNKRLFVICDETTLINDMSSIFQVYDSNCSNLFLILLYTTEGIFSRMPNAQGIFFNVGLQSFKVVNTDKDVNVSLIKNAFTFGLGPKVFMFKTTQNKKVSQPSSTTIDVLLCRDRFNYLLNKSSGDVN